MRSSLAFKALVGSALLALVSGGAKTDDYSNDGNDCNPETEQYLQVEAFDRYTKVDMILRFSQIGGLCGVPLPEGTRPAYWETFYDYRKDGDQGGRWQQLNLFVCAPFGEYMVNIEVLRPDGGSDDGIAWEVEHGYDEHHIWDTLNDDLGDIRYNPTEKGNYTWPLDGETGFYKTIYAGPMPPQVCGDGLPSGIEDKGCYKDDSLFPSLSETREEKRPDGMTFQVCSEFCEDYSYFGLTGGAKCSCGTAAQFQSAQTSEKCDVNYHYLCTGDSTMTCGGEDAIRVYHRTSDGPTPEPAPVPDPMPVSVGGDYSLEGCYADPKSSRLMGGKTPMGTMSAEICYTHCNNGKNTHFGTQYSVECWCAVEPDLTKNGAALGEGACDYACKGTSGEFCGGRDKMSVYVIDGTGGGNNDDGINDDGINDDGINDDGINDDGINDDGINDDGINDDVNDGFVEGDCYNDVKKARALNEEGKNNLPNLTKEVCVTFCKSKGHAYAGTQYGVECWCGGSNFGVHGKNPSACTDDQYSCPGNNNEICGGRNAFNAYSTGL